MPETPGVGAMGMQTKRFRKAGKAGQGIALGTLAAVVALLFWSSGVLDRWEYASWAWRVELFAKPGPATDKIKLILLDQASLDWGERENGWSWPWPREVYEPIIEYCKRSGARAIIFDVLFTEPSLYGVADDKALGAAISRASSFVAAMHLGSRTGDCSSWPEDVPVPAVRVENIDEWLADVKSKEVILPRAAFPIPEVAAAASVLGNVMDEPDMDGIFRRVSLFRIFDHRVIPSLGLAAYEATQRVPAFSRDARRGGPAVPSVVPDASAFPLPFIPREVDRAGTRLNPPRAVSAKTIPSAGLPCIEKGCLRVGEKRVPIDKAAKAILRFRGPSGTYESFSAAAVIQSELRIRAGGEPTIKDNGIFEDCYVFFGFSAPGLLDLRPTPIGRVYPGTEIYATMLDNLLSDDFLRDTPKSVVMLSTLLLTLFSSVLIVLSRNVWYSMAVLGVFLPVPVAAGLLAYSWGWWWPIVVQEGAMTLALVGGVVLNYATEGRRKTFIKHAFKHYLSPEVIERILEDPSHLKLGGERRELTIFFSDLQGFSSISERLDPQTLTSLLNEYLSEMTDIILQEGGTLDKYEGDAIIAFWNAPLTQQDHALRGCRAAIRCQHRLQELREEYRKRTGVELHMRIGVNTGEVVVGNMGSRKRFDYTVLGDAANLASRLEGANKAFGTWIMVSEYTWAQGSNGVKGREIGLLRVVGRKMPVRVYELLEFAEDSNDAHLEAFHHGLGLCYSGKWAAAVEAFETLPDDPVARVYARRCRKLMEDGDASWDGVWNLTEK